MLPEWTMVGFTGHRNIEDDAAARRGIAAAIDLLRASHAPLASVSSLAAGGDITFVEEVLRRDVPFFISLPMPRSEFSGSMTPEQWQRATALLDHALSVEELDGDETPEAAYLDCGTRMVDTCDVIIALWDRAPGQGMGGTTDIVEYARTQRKPMLVVSPFTGDVVRERLQLLPDHPGGQSEFASPREVVLEAYRTFDNAATRGRPGFLPVILLHLAAQAFAVTPLVFHWVGLPRIVFAATELSLLVTALVLALGMRQEHHTWMRNRTSAELCRSFLALWSLRRRGTSLPYLQVPSLAGLQRSLRMAWYQDRNPVPGVDGARDDYLANRVETQIEYFAGSLRAVAPVFRRLRRTASFLTFMAIVAGMVGLAISAANSGAAGNPYLELCTLLLPLGSAAILSLLVAEDYQRRAVRYREMLADLERYAARIRMARTWSVFTRLAVATEQLLLQEVLEWHSISRFTREPH